MKFITKALAGTGFIFIFFLACFAQQSRGILRTDEIKILQAEDERRFDDALKNFLDGKRSEELSMRALLAAGRIGDPAAVEFVAKRLALGSVKEQEVAAFALGEIESIAAADSILQVLRKTSGVADAVTARALEAAGKIAAANPNSPTKPQAKSVELGEAILDVLEAERRKNEKRNSQVIRLGLTAIVRTRPTDGDIVAAEFLTSLDPSVRGDAASTLTRLRSKAANSALRAMLMSDSDAVARANAARALGAAEDKQSLNVLIETVTSDDDSRVRVSAIRSLAAIKDPFAVEGLNARGETLLKLFRKRGPAANSVEKNEILEIASALGRLIPNTNDERSIRFLESFAAADAFRSPETEVALARISPTNYLSYLKRRNDRLSSSTRAIDGISFGLREFATLGDSAAEKSLKLRAESMLRASLRDAATNQSFKAVEKMPEILRSIAAFKPADLPELLRSHLKSDDTFVRATAAELIGDIPSSVENIEALNRAFDKSLIEDKIYNDAQHAILDALAKYGSDAARGSILLALDESDFLIRKKAQDIVETLKLAETDVAVRLRHESSRRNVQKFGESSRSKLGVILNNSADYNRSLNRKNGAITATVLTAKGAFTIELLPDDAPLTVDNFVKLARARYFDGIEVHRVVPNFVMQDGDPRGDGNGGPGWSIRCEINMVPYERGAVGMALSGKDTGGSQWFVTHSPQPHLDGGYTVFGKIRERDMNVVDKIVRGDKIRSIRINETPRQRTSLRRK